MLIQLLSDLHLETEDFTPRPARGAELLVLAGDIDASWDGLARFARWPVPVIFVAGNHEFDGRELRSAWRELRARCEDLGIRMLERETFVVQARDGRRVRFLGSVRWSDFDLLGASQRERCQRAAGYYVKIMRATLDGAVFDPAAVREESLACRQWLERELREGHGTADATVVITHYAPSARSADPRYGLQPGTASFCNADDDLLPFAKLWIHGHLHCRHDYLVPHEAGVTRVVSNARGHSVRGEADGYDDVLCLHV
ncbi:MAG TPA: metallophosphoesterase [Burkholderiaceae bacterium]|nr:metallophosphoesterase [Burkholderiaceae bacterium]